MSIKTWEEEFDEFVKKGGLVTIIGDGSQIIDVDCIRNFIRTKIEEAEKRGEERGRSKKPILTTCDRCGKEGFIGEYDGEMICQDCWANTLSPEDIANI